MWLMTSLAPPTVLLYSSRPSLTLRRARPQIALGFFELPREPHELAQLTLPRWLQRRVHLLIRHEIDRTALVGRRRGPDPVPLPSDRSSYASLFTQNPQAVLGRRGRPDPQSSFLGAKSSLEFQGDRTYVRRVA